MGCGGSSSLASKASKIEDRELRIDFADDVGRSVKEVQSGQTGALIALYDATTYVKHPDHSCVNDKRHSDFKQAKIRIPGRDPINIDIPCDTKVRNGSRDCERQTIMKLLNGRERVFTGGIAESEIEEGVQALLRAEDQSLQSRSGRQQGGKTTLQVEISEPVGEIDLCDIATLKETAIHPFISGIVFGIKMKISIDISKGMQSRDFYSSGEYSDKGPPSVHKVEILNRKFQLDCNGLTGKGIATVYQKIIAGMTEKLVDPLLWDVLYIHVCRKDASSSEKASEEKKLLDKGQLTIAETLKQAGIRRDAVTNFLEDEGAKKAADLADFTLDRMKKTGMTPSEASRLYQFLNGEVKGRPLEQEKLLDAIRPFVDPETMSKVEDLECDVQNFSKLIRKEEEFQKLIPYHKREILQDLINLMTKDTSVANSPTERNLKDVLQKWPPLLDSRGSEFKGSFTDYARRAKAAEKIVTTIDGEPVKEKVSNNTTDWVIQIRNSDKEYMLRPDEYMRKVAGEFSQGQEIDDDALRQKGFKKFVYTYNVLALQLKRDDVAQHFPNEKWPELPYDSEGRVENGDWILTILPEKEYVTHWPQKRFNAVFKEIKAQDLDSLRGRNLKNVLQKWLPLLDSRSRGSEFKGSFTDYARRAKAAEKIVTTIDGEVVKEKVSNNTTDWVIQIRNSEKEYMLRPDEYMRKVAGEFSQGQEIGDDALRKKGFKKFVYTYNVLALQLDSDDMYHHFPDEKWPELPYDSEGRVENGDWILTILPEKEYVTHWPQRRFNAVFKDIKALDLESLRERNLKNVLQKWRPLLDSRGSEFKGSFTDYARRAKMAEKIVTTIDGEPVKEKVSNNTTDWVIQIRNSDKEYMLRPDEYMRKVAGEFGQGQEIGDDALRKKGFKKFVYTYKVLALQLNSHDMHNHFPDEKWPELPYDSEGRVENGDWILTILPEKEYVTHWPQKRFNAVFKEITTAQKV